MGGEHDVRPQLAASLPVPWGQFLLGTIIGGVAVWMAVLNQSGVAPSTVLSGVAATYQTARDALLTPVTQVLGIELSPASRDALAVLAVLFAAIARTSLRYADWWWIIVFIVVLASASAAMLALVPHSWEPSTTDIAERWILRAVFLALTITIIVPLAGLVGRVMEPTARDLYDDLTAPPVMLTLWNTLVIAGFAAALLFINWAT